jgi:hypothetical protein
VKGFVHILRATSQQGPNHITYTVSFAPVGPTGTGGFVPTRSLQGKDALKKFLRRMRIGDRSVKGALADLETNGNASIPFIDLREDELQELGLGPIPWAAQLSHGI